MAVTFVSKMKVSKKKKEANNFRRFFIHELADVIREKQPINKVDGFRRYPVYFLYGVT